MSYGILTFTVAVLIKSGVSLVLAALASTVFMTAATGYGDNRTLVEGGVGEFIFIKMERYY